MGQDVPLTPATRRLLIGMLVLLVPVFGVFGWVVFRLTRPAEPCPLCDVVTTGDSAAVDRALADGAAVTDDAWALALQRVESPQDHGGPPLQIVAALLEHGADANFSWSSISPRASSGGASITLGGTTASTASAGGSSRRRHFAAAAIASDTDDVAILDRLLDRGLDPRGQAAGEALIAAAMAGHARLVSRLLDAGVPPNYVASQAPRRTALAEAIQTLNLDVIAALEAAGGREW